MRVFRLEFEQPPGRRTRWLGSYTAEVADRRSRGDRAQGGFVGQYEVPDAAVVEWCEGQLVFHQQTAAVVSRDGCTPTAPLVLTSAGSRRAKIEAAGGRCDRWSPPARGPMTTRC